jgi:hypothetical protein
MKKTNIAVKGHEGEFASAVVIDNVGDFVCKRTEAEHVGDGLVVDVIDDVVMLSCVGNVVGEVGIVGFDKAGHAGVRDGSQDLDVGLF